VIAPAAVTAAMPIEAMRLGGCAAMREKGPQIAFSR